MSQTKAPRALIVAVVVGLAGAAAAYLLLQRRQAGADFDVAQVLSARCTAAVVVPRPGDFGSGLGRLARARLAHLAASLLGYADADRLAAEWAREAGFDPRSLDSLRSAGLDPDRPLAIHVDSQGRSLMALPAESPGKLDELLARHAASRLGASERRSLKAGQAPVLAFYAPGQSAPAMARAQLPGYALVAVGPQALAALEAAHQLSPAASLAGNERFASLRRRMQGRSAFAYACPESPLTTQFNLPYGAGAGLTLDSSAVALGVDVPLSDDMAKELASFGNPLPADLAARLDPSAFARLRFGGDPAALKPYARQLTPGFFRAALVRAGVDVGQDVLGNLEPGLALSLALPPQARLGPAHRFDPRRGNLFQSVQLEALGRVRDPDHARATLEKLAAVAPHYRSRIESREQDGALVFTTYYPLGEGASIALAGDYAVVTGGAGAMERALARLKTPAPAKLLAEAKGLELVMDVARLSESLRALPDSAYGIGGFAIKAAVGRWLQGLDEVRSLTLRADLEQKVLRGELAVSLRPPAAGAREEAQP